MPTITPADVGSKFLRRLDSLLKDYKSLVHNVDGKLRQASLETLLAEQAVMSLGIYWEAFIHELIVAYIVQSPSTCIDEFGKRMAQSLMTGFPGGAGWITMNAPGTLSRSEVEMLLDPKGENITASDPSKLADKANKLIAAGFAPRFSLDADDAQFLTLLVSLRNFLAHRSDASRRKLRIVAAAQAGNNIALRATIANFPMYIKYSDTTGARVQHIVTRLKQLATKISGL